MNKRRENQKILNIAKAIYVRMVTECEGTTEELIRDSFDFAKDFVAYARKNHYYDNMDYIKDDADND